MKSSRFVTTGLVKAAISSQTEVGELSCAAVFPFLHPP